MRTGQADAGRARVGTRRGEGVSWLRWRYIGPRSWVQSTIGPRAWACACELAQSNPEIYFWMLQRKALTANDFANLETVAQHLYKFERYYESIAQPFEGEVQSERKLRRADLNALIAHMRSPDVAPKRVEIGRLDEYVRKFMKSRT